MPDIFQSKIAIDRARDVTGTFLRAVEDFNTQSWDDLSEILSDDIIVYKVSNLAYILGKTQAMAYFRSLPKGEFAPQFAVRTMTFRPVVYPVRVSGLAYWEDFDNGPSTPPETVKYEFQFDAVTLRLTSLWATDDLNEE